MNHSDDRTTIAARRQSGRGLRLLLAAACALLAACSDEAFVGDEEILGHDGTGQIAFQAASSTVTRANLTGADAASKLSNHFVVYATKHEDADEDNTAVHDKLVFNQYNVEWAAGSAGSTVTNTNDWDYLGRTAYSDAVITAQTTKYWDYNATHGYTFYAFASPDISYPAAATDAVKISKITAASAAGSTAYSKGYNVSLDAGAGLTDLYFADRKPVAKTDYSQPVQLTFRRFGAKVRVGFYETIPGYKVTLDAFHFNDSHESVILNFTTLGTTNHDNAHFRAALPNVKKNEANSYTVSYYASGDDENHPTTLYQGSNIDYMLTLGGNWVDKELGTSSAAPTYDLAGGAYTDVYPYESVLYPMLISCDYTLTSEEDEAEVLHIKDAQAVVPAEYARWRCGYAYTYLFKISTATNGHTGKTTDPAGLYPITFDAMGTAFGDNDQTTLTAMDKFAVTTFTSGGYVYVVCTDKTTGASYPISALGSEAGQAQLYYISTTGDPISEATLYAKLTGSDNGLSLKAAQKADGNPLAELTHEVPATDGSTYTFGTASAPGVLKFQYEAGKYYAFVYTVTKHVAPTYAQCTSSATYDDTTQYYTFENSLYFATAVTETQFNAAKTTYYTQTSQGVTGEYAVMLLDTRY